MKNKELEIRALATTQELIAEINRLEDVIVVDPPVEVSIVTSPVNAIAMSTAVCGGIATGEGVLLKGVCWALDTDEPSTDHPRTVNGAGAGTYISNLLGLKPGSRYFVRAYATTKNGTIYGQPVKFFTLALGGVTR